MIGFINKRGGSRDQGTNLIKQNNPSQSQKLEKPEKKPDKRPERRQRPGTKSMGQLSKRHETHLFLFFAVAKGMGKEKLSGAGPNKIIKQLEHVSKTVTLPEPPAPPNSRIPKTPTNQKTETQKLKRKTEIRPTSCKTKPNIKMKRRRN